MLLTRNVTKITNNYWDVEWERFNGLLDLICLFLSNYVFSGAKLVA